MFGFSITKLLFTAAAIAAVWYGFKWLGRMQERKAELEKAHAQRDKVRQKSGPSPSSPSPSPSSSTVDAGPEVEEMVECRVCGAFVAAQGAVDCGKSGCPY